MEFEKALDELSDKTLDILKVKEIYNAFAGDNIIESKIAMNLSMRTSVYDRSLGKSDTMIELLSLLAKSDSMEARWAVAKNPHTPIEILEFLSNDKINLVRALVATNPNTPSNILPKFFNDEKIVRDGLSGNPNTPHKYLNLLADDSDKMVRLRVAENPSTSKDILEKLSLDAQKDVSIAATKRLQKECA